MKTKILLITGILIGLLLFTFFNYLSINPIYGEIGSAIIVGTIFGKKIKNGSGKYAFYLIFTYSLIAWILTFLFTPDGRIALQYGGEGLFIIFGFLLILFLFYSMIGSLTAFVAFKTSTRKHKKLIKYSNV
jgi:hypothetical protein